MMDWIALIQTLGGIFSGLGLGMFTKSGRIKMQAEAHAKTVEAYEMQLKSASQQITTQDEINDQTRRLAQQIADLNTIYARMIEAMSVNMNVQAK